jgi:hypothetical protein
MGPGGPQQTGGQGMGPGVIEAVKSAIQWLKKQGMEIEDIIQTILKLAGQAELDIDEEQMRALIEQTAAEGGELPPQKGFRNKASMHMAGMGKAQEMGLTDNLSGAGIMPDYRLNK